MFSKLFKTVAVGIPLGAVCYYLIPSLSSLPSKLLAVIQPSELLELQIQTENLLSSEFAKISENASTSILEESSKATQKNSWKRCVIIVIISVAYIIICSKISKSKAPPPPEPVPIEIFQGLRNNSNFCYLNSMLQALASSEEFLRDLERIQSDIENSKSNDNQLDLFIGLLRTINMSKSNVNKNTEKLDLLMAKINWTKPDQQDTYELLAFLINTIEKNINFRKKILMPLKLEMVHKFSGINIPSKTQFHLGLSIGLCGEYNKSPGVTLEYLIDQYFAPTIIDDDPNKSSNLLFLGQPPNLLLLHIQANKWSSEKEEMIKPEYHIQYDEDLRFDAKCYINENSKPDVVKVHYKLTAIIHHMGSISGGHYITYRKWKNNWYLANDEQVSFSDFKCNICPYILLYEKC